MSHPPPTSDRWSLWSTDAFLAVDDAAALTAARAVADDVLAEVEQACSRFRSDSDLSEVNRRPGQWVRVDPLLVAATRVALRAAAATDGLVDPCLGRTLVALGYDSDLTDLAQLASRTPDTRPAPHDPDAWREVACTEDAVRIPPGVALDLGATAKAWAADLVAGAVVDALGCTCVVSLGGDLRVLGPEGTEASWPVHVSEVPGTPGVPVVVTGGLATSTTLVRRWGSPERPVHHLLDPRTGAPAREVYRTVTATGETCVAANTASTAALVLGAEAPHWLGRHGVHARLVRADGSVRLVGDWPAPDPTLPPTTLEAR